MAGQDVLLLGIVDRMVWVLGQYFSSWNNGLNSTAAGFSGQGMLWPSLQGPLWPGPWLGGVRVRPAAGVGIAGNSGDGRLVGCVWCCWFVPSTGALSVPSR